MTKIASRGGGGSCLKGQFFVQLCTENQCNCATLMVFYTNFATEFFQTVFTRRSVLKEVTKKWFSSKVQFLALLWCLNTISLSQVNFCNFTQPKNFPWWCSLCSSLCSLVNGTALLPVVDMSHAPRCSQHSSRVRITKFPSVRKCRALWGKPQMGGKLNALYERLSQYSTELVFRVFYEENVMVHVICLNSAATHQLCCRTSSLVCIEARISGHKWHQNRHGYCKATAHLYARKHTRRVCRRPQSNPERSTVHGKSRCCSFRACPMSVSQW